jgi:hypothetical protein
MPQPLFRLTFLLIEPQGQLVALLIGHLLSLVLVQRGDIRGEGAGGFEGIVLRS